MRIARIAFAITAALLLGALPFVASHGDNSMEMDVGHGPADHPDTPVGQLSYFRYDRSTGWMLAHIVLMILAWVVALPPAIMLSVARSRYHLPAQVLFHIFNGTGVFTGFVYNHSTPDLYMNNSHHPIGWVVSSLTVVWTVLSLFTAYNEHLSRRASGQALRESVDTQISAAHFDQLQRYQNSLATYRCSRDSGNFSGPGSRTNSIDSIFQKPEGLQPPQHDEEYGEEYDEEEAKKRGFLGNSRFDRFLSRGLKHFLTGRLTVVLRFSHVVLDKLLLLLGFLAIATGFLVYGGSSRDEGVFSTAAHFIKGSIFFWYGLLTLGRWMGAFTEFGWAWNVRPQHPLVSRWKSRVPSAEFTESFVIWFYGASNVFLEHLNAWGQAWSAQDFEHVSITLLFFSGGMLGMLIESNWARNMLNTTVMLQKSEDLNTAGASRFAAASKAGQAPGGIWDHPSTYRTSLNPMPGLVIMLLGLMMSSHHQQSMVSTMMHSQWGTLFVAFALARAVTYITLYLKPPSSHFPSRPPSELIAAFCLAAGGLMFMVSAHDIVEAIEYNGLDGMIVFTVTTSVTAAIMAWELVCFAIKGWAVRKEKAASGAPVSYTSPYSTTSLKVPLS